MPPILKKKKLWFALVGVFLAIWAAHTGIQVFLLQQEADSYSLLKEGDLLPGKTPLRLVDGKYTQFSAYEGKVVLLNFWAIWCGPCIQEMPSLYALQKKFSDKGFVVLGISMDEDPNNGIAKLTQLVGAPPFPNFYGNEQAIFHRFPIEGFPYTVVVDRKGVIRYSQAGERNWMEKDALQMIEGLL